MRLSSINSVQPSPLRTSKALVADVLLCNWITLTILTQVYVILFEFLGIYALPAPVFALQPKPYGAGAPPSLLSRRV